MKNKETSFKMNLFENCKISKISFTSLQTGLFINLFKDTFLNKMPSRSS